MFLKTVDNNLVDLDIMAKKLGVSMPYLYHRIMPVALKQLVKAGIVVSDVPVYLNGKYLITPEAATAILYVLATEYGHADAGKALMVATLQKLREGSLAL